MLENTAIIRCFKPPDALYLIEFSLNRNPMARILKSETIHDPTAPSVAVFSSRGPNNISPDILKVALLFHEWIDLKFG